jgi:hypothetical protein
VSTETFQHLLHTTNSEARVFGGHFSRDQVVIHSIRSNRQKGGMQLRKGARVDVPMADVQSLPGAVVDCKRMAPYVRDAVSDIVGTPPRPSRTTTPPASSQANSLPTPDVYQNEKRRRPTVSPEALATSVLALDQRIAELEASEAALKKKVASQADSLEKWVARGDAPVSCAALNHDPFLRANVRRITSFYSVEAFNSFLDMIDVNAHFSGIQPSDSEFLRCNPHTVILSADELAKDFPVGMWVQVALPVESDLPQLLDLELDSMAQVLSWVDASGVDSSEHLRVAVKGGRIGYVAKTTVVPDDGDGDPDSDTDDDEVTFTKAAPGEPGAASAAPRRPGRKRACCWQDAVLLVHYVCRAGLDLCDAAPLFHLQYSTACRYFTVYLQALVFWLAADMPYPSADTIWATTPSAFKKDFPGRRIQSLLDCHEQECESPSCPVLNRTMWSNYKQRPTAKGLGETIPCGAFVGAYPMVGGSNSDVDLTQSCGALLRMMPGWSTLADKGFMMHSAFAECMHELITPFKKVSGQKTFTADDMVQTSLVARNRIHVERSFKVWMHCFMSCFAATQLCTH